MFNPKQALERIRKNKIEKEQSLNNSYVSNDRHEDNPLFPQNQNTYQNYNAKKTFNNQKSERSENLQERMIKLQSLVSQLSQQLRQSNQTIISLKKQNSQLQTSLLKLQQKPQVQSKPHQIQNIIQTSRMTTSFHTQKPPKPQKQQQTYSPQVQDLIQKIKQQPIENILKRKEYNFRALKVGNKEALNKGERALKQLANIQKSYGKYYQRPTLIVNLEGQDFQ